MKEVLIKYLRFFLDLKGFLNNTISSEQAKSAISRRLERREDNFVNFLKDCIFSFSGSPYLPLFRHAGCSFADVVSEVKRHGVEGFLKSLKEAGVWMSFDEYKGHKMLRRGSFQYLFQNSDFSNPNKAGCCEISSGGTTGRPSLSHLYLHQLAERACYDHVMYEMLDLYGAPLALWYGVLPDVAGVSNTLRYCKIGYPPQRWFRLVGDRAWQHTLKSRVKRQLVMPIILWAGRFSKVPIPSPERLGLREVGHLLDWILRSRELYGKCAVQSYVSQAVRICVAASNRGVDLHNTMFIVGSEPVTWDKFRQVKEINAGVYPRYFASELGSIAMGCACPSEVGDYHLLSDMIALIQDEQTASGSGEMPLYFTGFSQSTPKVLLNVDIGDCGVVQHKHCGCLFGRMGFHTHLLRVRSSVARKRWWISA